MTVLRCIRSNKGAQGEGAISSRCFAVLNDLPLYLSARGVQGVYGTAVAEQRTIRSVSDAIVPKLSQETDLKTPVRWYSRANIIWQ